MGVPVERTEIKFIVETFLGETCGPSPFLVRVSIRTEVDDATIYTLLHRTSLSHPGLGL